MPRTIILAATQSDGSDYKRIHSSVPLDVIIVTHPVQLRGLTVSHVYETPRAASNRHYCEMVRSARARMSMATA